MVYESICPSKETSRRDYLKRIRQILLILVIISSLIGSPTNIAQAATPITFTGQELLGRPTATSITINIVPDETIEYHYQYGIAPGDYSWETSNATATGDQPHEVTLTGSIPQHPVLLPHAVPRTRGTDE